MRPLVLWCLSAILATLAAACQWRIGFNNDNGWLLYVADRVLGGARLYVDLVEINPPLIVWLNLPVVWSARVTGLDPVDVFRASVFLLALLASGVCERLSRRAFPSIPSGAVFLLCVVALLTLPVTWFGQREHLLLALVLPYLWLSAGRLTGWEPTGRGLPAVAGGFAALGLALKPQYLGVWALVLWLGTRSRRPLFRCLENRVVLLAGLAYLLLVAAAAPEYVELVRLLGDAYAQYRPQGLIDLLIGRFEPFIAVVALAVYASYRRVVRYRPLTDILALSTLACLVGVILQGKGFDYHYYPALGLAVLLAGATALSATENAIPMASRARWVAGALAIMVTAPYLEALVRIGLGPEHSEMQAYRTLERAVGPVRGRSLLVLAPRSGYAFGLVTYGGANWVGRFPCLWVPPALYRGRVRHQDKAGMGSAERWFRSAVVSDAVSSRPDLILVGVATPGVGPEDYWFDFLKYFAEDREFAELMAEYEEKGQAAGYRIYRRRSSASS